MIGQITKEFKFEAAHRLMHHKGACKNVHGHSYKITIGLFGESKKETGMIMDYGEMKQVIEPAIQKLDHAILLNKEDEELVEFIIKNNMRFMLFLGEPTAENIAEDILNSLKGLVEEGTHIAGATVIVKESATTSAKAEYVKGQ